MILNLIFWILFFILVYTYLGYPVILWGIVQVKKHLISGKTTVDYAFEPDVCLFVTAYNEEDFVVQKVENSLQLDYPKQKIQYLWVTDGSDDKTSELLRQYPMNEVHHQAERKGKMHAMNRGMKFVKAPIVVFSDTNTLLNKAAVREIVSRFSDSRTGCVAGEKRIVQQQSDVASAAGEGLYWKYESWMKKLDAELCSAVGAVGELFAIRRELFEAVEPDTILDDFIISLRIVQKGYKIDYTPRAYAEETASLNVKEELKRKIRIAAGGIQSLFRLAPLLNPLIYGVFSWQFISHKVLRWTLAPFSLFLLLVINGLQVFSDNHPGNQGFYTFFFYLQLAGYTMALIGWIFENRRMKMKLLFAPYYFVSINYASVAGLFRYFRGKQPVQWEKSKRAGSL